MLFNSSWDGENIPLEYSFNSSYPINYGEPNFNFPAPLYSISARSPMPHRLSFYQRWRLHPSSESHNKLGMKHCIYGHRPRTCRQTYWTCSRLHSVPLSYSIGGSVLVPKKQTGNAILVEELHSTKNMKFPCLRFKEQSFPCLIYCLPLWSSSQSSWLQIQRSGFDSRRYQIFWEVVDLERGPLSLVSTTQELLERKNSWSGLGSREYGRRDPWSWPRGTI
jgi:hypothetical protein